MWAGDIRSERATSDTIRLALSDRSISLYIVMSFLPSDLYRNLCNANMANKKFIIAHLKENTCSVYCFFDSDVSITG